MREFVAECLREWKRLGVPDRAADELAGELAADLAEAEAEGASAETVLGSSAADPRSFARSWASERGLVPRRRPDRRLLVLAGLLAVAFLVVIGASAAILASGDAGPRGAIWVARPQPVERAITVTPDGRFLLPPLVDTGGDHDTLASILLAVGALGLVAATALLGSAARPRATAASA